VRSGSCGLRRRRRRDVEGRAATLKVGVIPIADVALYVGIKQGFFEQEKLTIKPQLAEGGAQIVTSTVSGQYQVGFSNTTSLIIAGSKGLPVQTIAQGVLGAAKPTPKQPKLDELIREP
jgi:NitT/TauT family transport system substrate-binding protein